MSKSTLAQKVQMFGRESGVQAVVAVVGQTAAGVPVPLTLSSTGGMTGGGDSVDQGNLQVPTASTNGTELPNRPSVTSGVVIAVAAGASITWYLANTGFVPVGAPANTKTFVPASGSAEYSIRLSGTKSVFVTAVSGAVVFNWVYQP